MAKKALQPTLEQKVKSYLEKEAKLVEQLGLKRRLVLDFPRHKKVPLLGRIAGRLLMWSGGHPDIRFTEAPKK